jgi:hypothetical protein
MTPGWIRRSIEIDAEQQERESGSVDGCAGCETDRDNPRYETRCRMQTQKL